MLLYFFQFSVKVVERKNIVKIQIFVYLLQRCNDSHITRLLPISTVWQKKTHRGHDLFQSFKMPRCIVQNKQYWSTGLLFHRWIKHIVKPSPTDFQIHPRFPLRVIWNRLVPTNNTRRQLCLPNYCVRNLVSSRSIATNNQRNSLLRFLLTPGGRDILIRRQQRISGKNSKEEPIFIHILNISNIILSNNLIIKRASNCFNNSGSFLSESNSASSPWSSVFSKPLRDWNLLGHFQEALNSSSEMLIDSAIFLAFAIAREGRTATFAGRIASIH